MGIGSAAPQSGLEVGWDAQFDGDVDILGDIEANNLKLRSSSTVTDIISAYGNWTIRSANAHLWGRLCHLYLYVYNSAALTAGTEYRVGTLKAAYKPRSYMTFGCENGGGCVDTSGNVYFVPSVNVNANILLRIGSVYFV